MRKLIIVLVSVLLSFSAIAAKPIMPDELTSAQKLFVSRCSNIKLESMQEDSEVLNIAYTNCMGRVTGFTDGFAYAHVINNSSTVRRHWCIRDDVIPIDVFTTLLNYVEINQTYTINFLSLPSADSTTAFSIIIRHLKKQYPCGPSY